ncbi:acyltransferase domain-containing protein [Amycolatopsis sp. NPDC051716]|uniref:acyltransferase domain-containing protein n=1 Tax=Amycolatopsis sp. NPDC051716 TaxID=3155804 RepID=UPI0034334386
MPTRTAFLFPGQGSYLPGLFGNLVDRHPVIGETLSIVDEVAGRLGRAPVSPMLLDPGSPNLQELVEHDPPALHLAIFASSVTAFRLLTEDYRVRPDLLLGHSFGELTALTAAGALTLEDGAHVVAQRDESLSRIEAPRGGLVALNCGARRAQDIIGALDEWHLAVAADNGPGQVVVSGPDEELARVHEVATALGLTATRLRIPYPFHNPLLADTADDFGERVADVPRRVPRLPVYSAILGRYIEDVGQVGRVISGHLVLPVRFLDAAREIHADGARRFVESGPKGVLVDLVAAIVPGAVTVAPLRKRTDRRGLEADLDAVPSLARDGRATVSRRPAPPGRPEAPAPGPVDVAEAAPVPVPVPTPRAETSTAEESAPPAAAGRDAVFDTVRTVYADLLGYPPDALEPDADLEADLGIDSIKQTEAFTRTLEHFGIPPADSGARLTNYPTMDAIVDLVMRLRDDRHPVGSDA